MLRVIKYWRGCPETWLSFCAWRCSGCLDRALGSLLWLTPLHPGAMGQVTSSAPFQPQLFCGSLLVQSFSDCIKLGMGSLQTRLHLSWYTGKLLEWVFTSLGSELLFSSIGFVRSLSTGLISRVLLPQLWLALCVDSVGTAGLLWSELVPHTHCLSCLLKSNLVNFC